MFVLHEGHSITDLCWRQLKAYPYVYLIRKRKRPLGEPYGLDRGWGMSALNLNDAGDHERYPHGQDDGELDALLLEGGARRR